MQVFLKYKKKPYCRNFGLHTKFSQNVAEIHLSKKREEILLGKFEMEIKRESKTFGEVADIWFKIWKEEINPNTGTPKHNESSCYKIKQTIKAELKTYFGEFHFEDIKPVTVQKWRDKRAKTLSGTTINRYQAILRSIFSHIEDWVKTEKIKPAIKCPKENPCIPVEMAPMKKRSRILSKYEYAKLINAFKMLNDLGGIEIVDLAIQSVLSLGDLKNLEIGDEINITRAKTGVPVNIPIVVLAKLNFFNWRKRWEKAKFLAGLSDLQFRDLRKSGGNWLKGNHDIKLISEYMGHADVKTTEKHYMVKEAGKLTPLAEDLKQQLKEAKLLKLDIVKDVVVKDENLLQEEV